MTFNIFEGGDSPLSNRMYRRDIIARIIRDARPDIVALQECTNWDEADQKILHEFEEQVGMTALLAVTDGFPVALLVRPEYGILHADALTDGFWHGILDVVVADANNETTRFINAHLHPNDPLKKGEEVGMLLGRYKEGGRTVILGDMNSLSHLDNLDISNLSEETRARHVFGGEIDYSVSRAMEEAGFLDVYALLHDGDPVPTIPTAAAEESKFTPVRLDYIYVTSDLRSTLASIEVVRTADSDTASDHYPLLLDIADGPTNGQA